MKSQDRIDKLDKGADFGNLSRRDHWKVHERCDEYSGELARGSGNAPIEPHEEDCPRKKDHQADCECEGNARDYADTVGERALRVDAFQAVKRDYDRAIETYYQAALKMERIRLSLMSKPTAPDDVTWCHSCARVEDTATGKPLQVPARPGGLNCDFCDRLKRDLGREVPLMLVEMHSRGQTVSTLAIERALRSERRGSTTMKGPGIALTTPAMPRT